MYYNTLTMPNGMKWEYTFLSDFDIADHFGIKAIQDTFKRAKKEWKHDIKAIAEMTVALNMRCWFWYYQKNTSLSQIYEKLFYELKNWVYEKGKYTEEELNVYFEYTD